MAYEWTPDQYQSLAKEVLAARDLLEDWFWAMENNTAEGRFPDPTHPVQISQETADKIVEELDEEFDKELRAWAHQPEAGGNQAGPEFKRLKPPQRLALAQQLHAILKSSST